MLSFSSASVRIVNTRRAIQECMEIALGSNYSDVDLIIVHASIGHDFYEIIDTINEMAPQAQVVAASCCAVVGKEGVSESLKDMAIMAIKGKDFSIAYTDDIYGHNSYEKMYAMANQLKESKADINMVYTLSSGIDIANDASIKAIEDVLGRDIQIFGATSSDNMKGVTNYQAANGNIFKHGAYLVGFADPSIKIVTSATHGFVAIGQPLIVTKSDGHIIKEFNNKPAWSEYTQRLGLTSAVTCGDTIPIGALGEKLTDDLAKEYGNSHILRVVTKHEGDDMYYATNCPVGTELWLTSRDEELIFKETERMVAAMKEQIGDHEIVAVFHADCLARGRFLFNRVMKEEIVSKMQYPFYKDGVCPPWLGMYGFGEFANLGKRNTYHNYTTALFVMYR